MAILLLLAACAGLLGVLARPQGETLAKEGKSTGRNVLIALDISRSMRVADVSPDRLTRAKIVIYEMLEAMPDDLVGLIGFAGTPNLYAPFTFDHEAIRETVEQIDETWAPVGGTNLATAIRMAIKTFGEAGGNGNVLVLLSDGDALEGDLNAAIEEARRAGISVFAIGTGTVAGGQVPSANVPGAPTIDRSGRPVRSSLQSQTLEKLASRTGGRYLVAGAGTDIAAIVKAAAGKPDAPRTVRKRRDVVEYFQWALLPVILCLIFSLVSGTRWKGISKRSGHASAWERVPSA